ncbi:LAFE_0D02916g1_1 [Lachancea fermentati]|uniref:LAFE_0D02916g1_1 n=1 Tax=Lachancea fermentati TaxID=4955 RepID=A0A1G4MAV3_LACFM|nr:LAFE_0D02916g1_1 [Lachancea fermentati]
MSEITNCHIDPSFTECIKEVQSGISKEDKFYINVEPSVYEVNDYIVHVSQSDGQLRYDAGNGNYFKRIDGRVFEAELNNQKFRFKTPRCDYSHIQPNSHFTCIDVLQEKIALGDSEGLINVFDSNFNLNLQLTGHYSDITSVKFFPSQKVLLSSSSDMQVKIWSLDDGSNPRTLAEHRAAVTCTGIVDRGRNILTGSEDGTIKLWECGSGEVIYTFFRKENKRDAVNDILLLCTEAASFDTHDLEFGTAGKTFLAAHHSGVITYHDIFSKEQLLQIPSEFMNPCITLSASNTQLSDISPFYLYAGYENGTLAQWDLRKPERSVQAMHLNKGTPINNIYFDKESLYVSSNVDTTAEIEIDLDTGRLRDPTFLVSNDCEVSQFKSSGDDGAIFAVGKQGFWAVY